MQRKIREWKKRPLRKEQKYLINIPDTSKKHAKIRKVLNGKEVVILKKVGSYLNHDTFIVSLLDADELSKDFPKEFKLWGPYICCSCSRKSPVVCNCGGY